MSGGRAYKEEPEAKADDLINQIMPGVLLLYDTSVFLIPIYCEICCRTLHAKLVFLHVYVHASLRAYFIRLDVI